MSDLISREDAINCCRSEWEEEVEERLRLLPSAERKGHWTKRTTVTSNGNTYYSYECSECGDHHGTMWKYCPHCGARMEGEEERNE